MPKLHYDNRRQMRAPPRPPKGLLSLRDYTVIHAALEIVVHWGVSPLLEPGVGVFDADKRPRSRAVKLSSRVLHYWGEQKQQQWSPEGNVDDAMRDTTAVVGGCSGGRAGKDAREQLRMCAAVIQGVIFTQQFMPMLMPLYIPDILAARLQLAYGRSTTMTATALPSAAPVAASAAARDTFSSSVQTNLSKSADKKVAGDGKMNPLHEEGRTAPGDRITIPSATMSPSNLNERHEADRDDEGSSLRNLLRDLGPRQVMSALRHLLSQGARAPPWLRQRAGRLLSQIVLRPGGVQATLEVYLAGAGGGGDSGDGGDDGMKACLRVARLLASPPKSVGTGVYVARVAPQLAEMLQYDGQQRTAVTRQEG